MVLKLGRFGQQIRNTWKVLKCGAGDGWRIQVRENPILYSHKIQLNIKLSLLQHYNDMFRPKLSAIFRLYMKPI